MVASMNGEPGEPDAAPFAFDPSASPADNIASFLTHIESVDAAFTGILRTHADDLISDGKSGKKDARKLYTQAVLAELDARAQKNKQQPGEPEQ